MKRVNIILFSLFIFVLAMAQDIEELNMISTAAGITQEEAIQKAREMGFSEKEIKKAIEGEKKEGVKHEEKIVEEEVEEEAEEMKEVMAASPPRPGGVLPFGYDIFNLTPRTFEPLDVGPVDPEYPIGPGDEIIIRLWGEVEDFHSLVVDREGKIFVPNVGRMIMNGLNLEDVRKKLITGMASAYSGIKEKTTFVDVSLGKLKKIKVFIVGEVVRPGGYTIPSVSMVFNALYYAGGPTTRGSLRKVKVIRHNKVVAEIDLYEYLLSGERKNDIRLHNFDTILVPPIGKRVSLTGRVHRPAVYELADDEGLKELIEIAGGVESDAYTERIQITRILKDEMKEIVDINLKEILESESENFTLNDGDGIVVFPILNIMKNYVDLKGNVQRPGRYELAPGITIKDLIQKADGIYEDTYLNRALIIRTLPDLTKTIIRFNLWKALMGDTLQNHLLERWDVVMIRSIWDVGIEKIDTIFISGHIANPGSYEFYDGMTLKDLIFIAGGLKEEAYRLQAEISRIIPERGTDSTEVIFVEMKEGYGIDEDTTGTFFLQGNDIVFIRKNPYWELQRNVTVEGEVTFPGIYSLETKEERLSNLINRAGGLKETAYPEGARFLRSKNNVGRIDVDLKDALRHPSGVNDLILEKGDYIFIPRQEASVYVKGEVRFPISVLHEPSKNVSHYIKRAGGFTDDADKKHIKLILPNGRITGQRKFLWLDITSVPPGSMIIVPKAKETGGTEWGEVIKNVSSVVSSVVMVIFVIDRLNQ
ncbi:SLBB domain-containing protein [candidate division WOR-3 bacterium]|nr:SLBB domain-containing protein [candidate division WOR-3 bacterium]